MDIEKEFERLGLGKKEVACVSKLAEKPEPRTLAMKYKIIHSNDPQQIAEKVTLELAKGWRLQGGVTIAFYGDDTGFVLDAYKYAQAMVKD